jgi:hypothetical protein
MLSQNHIMFSLPTYAFLRSIISIHQKGGVNQYVLLCEFFRNPCQCNPNTNPGYENHLV